MQHFHVSLLPCPPAPFVLLCCSAGDDGGLHQGQGEGLVPQEGQRPRRLVSLDLTEKEFVAEWGECDGWDVCTSRGGLPAAEGAGARAGDRASTAARSCLVLKKVAGWLSSELSTVEEFLKIRTLLEKG